MRRYDYAAGVRSRTVNHTSGKAYSYQGRYLGRECEELTDELS